MFTERDIDITELVKLNNDGLQVADYNQIINALALRFKEAYGSNIDLTMTTADGIFLHNTALMINNILQTMYTMYKNLNVNSASGSYLTALCRLSNVDRKSAEPSKASLNIYSETSQSLPQGAIFLDASDTEWIYEDDEITTISTDSSEPTTIEVKCSVAGPVQAPAGSINRTLYASDITVIQPQDATIGWNDETDSELRARRSQSTGLTGVTVLQSLQGALLSFGNIQDVYIYNNNKDTTNPKLAMADGTKINGHSIYVVIRGNSLDDTRIKEKIANTIFQKLTPGIDTNAPDTTAVNINGTLGTYDVEVIPSEGITQTISWKNATPIHPACSVTIKKNSTFDDSTINLVKQGVIKYLNSVRLSNLPDAAQMIIAATYSDPTFKGAPTFVVTGASAPATNYNTYYEYNDATVDDSVTDYLTFNFTYSTGE